MFEKERSLLAALRLEEEKQRRLERTRTLKLILSKKLGALKLRMVLNMMNRMSLEDLEMEVDEVEVRIMEMMETDEMTDDATYNQKGEYVNSEVEMTDAAATNFEINNDAPTNKQGKHVNTDVGMVDKAASNYDSNDDAPSNQHGKHVYVDIEMKKKNNAVSSMEDHEKFGSIGMMISRWEAQEAEENTPIVEMVRTRRRSKKLDDIVLKLNLESEIPSIPQNTELLVEVKTISKRSNDNLLYPAGYQDEFFAPESSQTNFHKNNRGIGGVKRKCESNAEDYGRNDRKSDGRSGPGTYKRSRLYFY